MLWIVIAIIVVLLGVLVVYDLTQRHHAILRSFPVIGHFRYILEAIGPELRQYIVTDNDEERPFSRDQRRWVYASSKKQNNYFGFGTDNDLELEPNYLIIKHATFPDPETPLAPVPDALHSLPCAKVMGGARGRTHAFRPRSIINVSAMSYGSLSAPAVRALNEGCATAHALHNTGEGGIAPHHLHGGDLIWQIGTGYFGCRNERGRFDRARFIDAVAAHPVRAVEIKLSQGAKPGLGGVLPAGKISPEIAEIRGIPMGRDCISPPTHSAFRDVDSMLDFIEDLAQTTGVPVGIKSAVGDDQFWHELAERMAHDTRGVDFITIDGGEGGTGAAPLVFSDHVAHPFKVGFSTVYRTFAERGIADRVVFGGSGKLGFPQTALLALAMGCDTIGVAREAMLAIGCIQAQRCHSGHCPTGVATQNRWLMRGLDPTLKAARLANYVVTLRKELGQLARACGKAHPALVTLDQIDVLDDHLRTRSARELFNYDSDWGLPSADQKADLLQITIDGATRSEPDAEA